MSEQVEKPGRYQRSPAGMVGALIVLLGLVGAFVAVRALNRTEVDTTPPTVDYRKVVASVREQSDFPVLAPARLPEGWRATSARFRPEPGSWHLGVLTDQQRYVGLEQARTSVSDLVETYVDAEAVPGGPVEVGGRTWRTWTDEGGDVALTREQGGVATLVVSSLGRETVVDYVRRLR